MEFCPICFISLPSFTKERKFDFNGSIVLMHYTCLEEWTTQEVKSVLFKAIEDLKAICEARSSNFCKKIQKRLRIADNLEGLKNLFKEIVLWVKERFIYLQQAINYCRLPKLCSKINYLAEILKTEEVFFLRNYVGRA